MDQHPVPRQITTFEFKLIGILTVRQFLYLLISAGFAVIVFFLTPVRFLNYFFALVVFSLGTVFSLVKYNERPLDVWIKNLFTRLVSPSQYYYQKKGDEPLFQNTTQKTDPALTAAHLDAQQKLASYTQKTLPQTLPPQSEAPAPVIASKTSEKILVSPHSLPPVEKSTPPEKKLTDEPYLFGVVKNNKDIALPGMMVYIKRGGAVVRLLKTNGKGVFATFHPLDNEEYSLETKDPKGAYFFNDVPTHPNQGGAPITIHSKERL